MAGKAEIREAVLVRADFASAQNVEKNYLINKGLNAQPLNVLIADTR